MLRHYRNKHGGDHGHTSTKAKHLRITKHPTQTRQQRRKHHPHRRTRQLVGFGRYPYSKGRLRPEDITHIDQALEFLNLVDLQDRYLDELSGSQRQRAYVAMVLAQDTDYVLLDEPLNNLDMQHSVQMMKPSATYSTPPFRCLITKADYSPAIFNP